MVPMAQKAVAERRSAKVLSAPILAVRHLPASNPALWQRWMSLASREALEMTVAEAEAGTVQGLALPG